MNHGELESLKIFTLNCWGLRYFSQHRKPRIKLIAQHLAEHDYDIVFLQEVWIQSDFEYIRTKTKSIYTFAHMFNNASILGTSGLVILAKWIPKIVNFHPYSINGSPFRLHHGDWFSTKGVAYARVELKGFNLHLFCTHMHAQYDDDEDITDQYSIHRICQSYELAKYINMMFCSCSNSSSKDLIILAGDMNTSSKELPYRLLVELTGLYDCYKFDRKKKNFRKKELSLNGQMKKSYLNRLKFHHCSDESSDEELITCGHKENTFTNPKLVSPNSSKRIDFILFKLRDCKLKDHFADKNGDTSRFEAFPLWTCLPEQMKISAKDVSGLSYSDHQPVAAKLSFICYHNKAHDDDKDNDGGSTNCGNTNCNISEKCASAGNLIEDINVAFDSFNNTEARTKSNEKTSEVKCKKGSKLTTRKEDHGKTIIWKHVTSSALSHQFQSPAYSKLNNLPILRDIEDLLADYINANTPFKHIITASLVLFVILTILTIAYLVIDLSTIEMILFTIILMIVSMFGLFLRFVTHRHEINAIKAIFNEISKKETLCTDYGLLQNSQ